MTTVSARSVNVHTSTVAHRPKAVLARGLALATTVVALAGCGAGPPTTTPGEFTVWGDIDGLYPGAVATLDAHVANPWDASIEVISVVVDVADAAPDCPGSTLSFAPTARSVIVAARSQAVVPLEVRMDAAADDACRGVTWPLEFSARAIGPDGRTHHATGSAVPPATPSP
jgi:hypothetical protein